MGEAKNFPLIIMKRIFVGVCSYRHDDKFWDSFFKFMNECSNHYDITSMIIKDVFLPDAQNSIAEAAINSRHDYILFLDDDHWGHTKEMLDCLINANTNVATISTYSRHYPYSSVILDKRDKNLVIPVEHAKGYRECDLTGFPMTLIRCDLFRKLDKPYFRPVEAEGRNWNTDIDFFERLNDLGVKPIGCFQHRLPHDKITKENVVYYRNKEKFEKNNIAWFKVLQSLT